MAGGGKKSSVKETKSDQRKKQGDEILIMNKGADYRMVMLVVCLSAGLVPLMGSALNLALPYINAEFSLNARAAGWIATSYMLSTAIFQIPCARLADMVGRKRVYISGMAVFFLFSVLSGLAGSGGELIAYRALSGIGSAMIFSSNVAILTSAVPPEKRGWALGMNSASVYFSLAAGPFIGGFITQAFGWHGIFFMAAGLSLCLMVAAIMIVKDNWRSEKVRRFDYAGAVIYATGLSTLIYGFSRLPQAAGIALTVAGGAILWFFVYYERRAAEPLLDIKVFFINKIFRHGTLSALINYSATTSIAFMLSLYLQYVRGLTPTQAGSVLVGQSLVMALVSLGAGRMSDLMAPRKLAASGMLIIAVGLVMLCFITATTSFYYIIGVLIVIGFGFGVFSSPNMNIIMSSVGKEDYGLASAATGTFRLVGQAFSMGLAMMAISIVIGSVQLSPDVHEGLIKSLRITFMVSSALCLYGIYSSSVRNKKLDREERK